MGVSSRHFIVGNTGLGAARADGARRLAYLACAALVPFLATGCDRKTTVRGAVVDVGGAALPGVGVTVHGTEIQTTTDGIGRYALRCPPGSIELDFIKTGYTPGRLILPAAESRAVAATQVILWPVPLHQGVYFFEGGRYRETTRTEPKRYLDKDRAPVCATKAVPELETESAMPLLISTRLPAYDVGLYELTEIEAVPSDYAGAATPGEDDASRPYTERVWAPGNAVNVIAAPIDEPEGQLLELRLGRPLTPGVYAVHWGALDGHASTSPYAFLFRVAEPAAAEPPEGEPSAVRVEGEPQEAQDSSG